MAIIFLEISSLLSGKSYPLFISIFMISIILHFHFPHGLYVIKTFLKCTKVLQSTVNLVSLNMESLLNNQIHCEPKKTHPLVDL